MLCVLIHKKKEWEMCVLMAVLVRHGSKVAWRNWKKTLSLHGGQVRYDDWNDLKCMCGRKFQEESRWVFPKIGVPQNGWFIPENHIKWMILGYPYFWKHPYIVWNWDYQYFSNADRLRKFFLCCSTFADTPMWVLDEMVSTLARSERDGWACDL